MSYPDFRQIAGQVDQAHQKASRHAFTPREKHSQLRVARWFSRIAILLLSTGVLYWVYSALQQLPSAPVTPVETPAIETRVQSDALQGIYAVIEDPSYIPEPLHTLSAIDAYNAVIQAGQQQVTKPLAMNLLSGYLDAATAIMYTSVGFAEIDKELLSSEASLDSTSLISVIGQPIPEPKTLDSKISFIQKIDNALSLDPYDVVSQSLRRDEMYDLYLHDLKTLLQIAEQVSSDTLTEAAELDAQAAQSASQRDATEAKFIAMTSNLEAQNLESTLETFHELSAQTNALKSRSSVLKQLQKMYIIRIQNITLRIEGVEKNRDAIIKNVRVTPVTGSGVDLTQ